MDESKKKKLLCEEKNTLVHKGTNNDSFYIIFKNLPHITYECMHILKNKHRFITPNSGRWFSWDQG
jgi:hypothetical protein